MFAGETVEVFEQVQTGLDGFNKPIFKMIGIQVNNVLVSPGTPVNTIDSIRPDGVLVAYTLQFPKLYTGDLRGKKISVRGKTYKVVGFPGRYLSAPGDWNMTVEVEASDG